MLSGMHPDADQPFILKWSRTFPGSKDDFTGRDAAPELIEAADLVSEVVKVKHQMEAGIRAQQGIEW